MLHSAHPAKRNPSAGQAHPRHQLGGHGQQLKAPASKPNSNKILSPSQAPRVPGSQDPGLAMLRNLAVGRIGSGRWSERWASLAVPPGSGPGRYQRSAVRIPRMYCIRLDRLVFFSSLPLAAQDQAGRRKAARGSGGLWLERVPAVTGGPPGLGCYRIRLGLKDSDGPPGAWANSRPTSPQGARRGPQVCVLVISTIASSVSIAPSVSGRDAFDDAVDEMKADVMPSAARALEHAGR